MLPAETRALAAHAACTSKSIEAAVNPASTPRDERERLNTIDLCLETRAAAQAANMRLANVARGLSSPDLLTSLMLAAARASAAGVLDHDGLGDVVERRLLVACGAAGSGCRACGTTQDTSHGAGSTAGDIIRRVARAFAVFLTIDCAAPGMTSTTFGAAIATSYFSIVPPRRAAGRLQSPFRDRSEINGSGHREI